MAKKTHTQPTKSCADCIHEYACRMWTDGRMISDESASRCPNHTTVKESAAYLIGKMDGEKHAILTADVAPRAEVAREIFKAIEKTVNDCVVGESLFKPAYFEFRKFNEHLAALKKKYTDAEPPKGDAS